jgi:hypothetical protein
MDLAEVVKAATEQFMVKNLKGRSYEHFYLLMQ